MKKSFRRKITVAGFLILTILCLCACKAKTARELKKDARAQHGHAKVISKTTSDTYSCVVLEDKLQGFTYTVSSSLSDVSFDGASFGKSEHTYDDFDERLMEYCYRQVNYTIDRLCSQYDATYYPTEGVITVNDPNNAKAVSEGCAKALITQNKENRLDGKEIYVYDQKDNLLGSVKLPECTYTPQ